MRIFIYQIFSPHQSIQIIGHANDIVRLSLDQALRVPQQAIFAMRYSMIDSKFYDLSHQRSVAVKSMHKYLGVHLSDDGHFTNEEEKTWFLLKYATNTTTTLDFPD